MPSTCGGAESSCRRSTASNRRPGFHDCGRMDTAWSSSGSSRRGAADLAVYHERDLCRAASALVSLDIGDDVLDSADLLANLGCDVLSHRALVPPGSEP